MAQEVKTWNSKKNDESFPEYLQFLVQLRYVIQHITVVRMNNSTASSSIDLATIVVDNTNAPKGNALEFLKKHAERSGYTEKKTKEWDTTNDQ